MGRSQWSVLMKAPDPSKRPLAGLVLREHVAALLAHRRDGRDDRRDLALSSAGFDGPQTPPRRLASGRRPLDLGPVMVRSPYVVYADCPLSRAYRLFVTMGLRHSRVCRRRGQLRGGGRDAGGPGILLVRRRFCKASALTSSLAAVGEAFVGAEVGAIEALCEEVASRAPRPQTPASSA